MAAVIGAIGMSDRGDPWWYSGGEQPHKPSGGALAGFDWTALTSGAQRLVEWASERVMAPHADHTDPREHPQCILCRTMVLVADRAAHGETAGAGDDGHHAEEIVWIPFVDGSVADDSGGMSTA